MVTPPIMMPFLSIADNVLEDVWDMPGGPIYLDILFDISMSPISNYMW